MNGNKITMIEIDKLSPHPDNPRKELGDLAELAESIKEKGVLQNLTVVPWFSEITKAPAENGTMDGYYRIIIGHRRHAAAKLAGLTELPCVISDMEYKDQIATMLLENIQRNDLTVYEQALGFQMMLDLGESIDGICKKTGLSQSTVRHRIKMAELDQETLKKKSEEVDNISINDLIAIERIKDPERKNEALQAIGTRDFDWRLKRLEEEEKSEERREWLIGELKETGIEETKDAVGLDFFCYMNLHASTNDMEAKLEKIKECENELFYKAGSLDITVYEKREDNIGTDEDREPSAEDRKEQERRNKLNQLVQQAEEMHDSFVKNIKEGQLKKKQGTILRECVRFFAEDGDTGFDITDIADLVNISEEEIEYIIENDDDDNNAGVEALEKAGTLKSLFAALYLSAKPGRWYPLFNYSGEYIGGHDWNKTLHLLKEFGYKVSEEEQALVDGTHELYVKKDNQGN